MKPTFKEKQKVLFERLRKLRTNATESELIAKSILEKNNVYHIFQKCFIKGDAFVIVDFYLPKRKICIELDGEYHFTNKQMSKDAWKDRYLKSRKFTVIRIKNEDCHNIISYLR